ncbi:hypothetical protein FA13DRAFT_1740316 [Coprinellus micaceus]|uniref:DUF7888 domain-containing protein n=1 Tax=Coprinellus micaceus TaxID=71717 RepID=A0A4Y7SMV0_COPMI|nr:hypothetical protein FA13DRAFT_1740316 [Coprinellus micaceus]
MRFHTIILCLLAGTASLVSALPASESFTEAQLVLRADGDVATLTARSPEEAVSELLERDAAFAVASGAGSLNSRDLSTPDIEELVLRSFGFDEDLLIEERDGLEYDEVLEARFGKAVGQAVKVAVKGIKKIIDVIKGKIEKDKARRSQFTSDFIKDAMAKYRGWNWVICHTKHKTDFKGENHHRHEEFKVSFGKTIGYEIYWFKAGTFERQGDGGYLNWAYGGNIVSKSKDGKKITFK